jgi:hypothetical protein
MKSRLQRLLYWKPSFEVLGESAIQSLALLLDLKAEPCSDLKLLSEGQKSTLFCIDQKDAEILKTNNISPDGKKLWVGIWVDIMPNSTHTLETFEGNRASFYISKRAKPEELKEALEDLFVL